MRGKTRPEVETAIRRAEAAYKEGNATYLIVLEANRQLVTTPDQLGDWDGDAEEEGESARKGEGAHRASVSPVDGPCATCQEPICRGIRT